MGSIKAREAIAIKCGAAAAAAGIRRDAVSATGGTGWCAAAARTKHWDSSLTARVQLSSAGRCSRSLRGARGTAAMQQEALVTQLLQDDQLAEAVATVQQDVASINRQQGLIEEYVQRQQQR